jgi:hypothetical protein
MSPGDVTQQMSKTKPSGVPFLELLGIPDGDAAPTQAAASASPQAESDTSASNHPGSQQKKPQAAPAKTSTEITAAEPAQLVDVTACLPMTKDTLGSIAELRDCKVFAGVSTASLGVGDSPDSKTSVPGQPAPNSELSPCATQSPAMQQRLLAAILLPQPALDRAPQAMNGADKEGAKTAEPATGNAQTNTQPDTAQVENDQAGSTLSTPGTGVASQISIALEGVLASPRPSSSDLNPVQNTNRVSQGTRPGAISLTNSDETTSKTQVKVDSVEPVSAASRGGQSSQVSTQHPQIDAAQSSALTTKTSDAGVLPGNVAVPHSPVHDSPAPSGISGDAAGLHRAEEGGALLQNHLDGAEASASGGVNAARVIQTMSESEMRVGMHSVEFGDISVRTSISQQQLFAQITVDHRDLGTAISSHIPLAQAKLGNDFGIHASIEVNQSGASLSGERQNPKQQAQRQAAGTLRSPGGSLEPETNRAITVPISTLNDAYRLDIRA